MDAVDLLDTWKSFGSLISSKGNSVEKSVLASKLQNSFAKTADKVVYIYDDAIVPNIYDKNGNRNLKITQEFANWMINQNYKGYLAREFLKINQKKWFNSFTNEYCLTRKLWYHRNASYVIYFIKSFWNAKRWIRTFESTRKI